MKKLMLGLALVVFSCGVAQAAGYEGTFFNKGAVPAGITSVKAHVFNMALTDGCSAKQCFRVDIYLNDVYVARWVISPGLRKFTGGFQGINTPIYDGAAIGRIMSSKYVSHRGDPMPHAMFVGNSGVAFHKGKIVGQGAKASHGCMRMLGENAAQLNAWMREARNNGGGSYVWTQHTR